MNTIGERPINRRPPVPSMMTALTSDLANLLAKYGDDLVLWRSISTAMIAAFGDKRESFSITQRGRTFRFVYIDGDAMTSAALQVTEVVSISDQKCGVPVSGNRLMWRMPMVPLSETQKGLTEAMIEELYSITSPDALIVRELILGGAVDRSRIALIFTPPSVASL